MSSTNPPPQSGGGGQGDTPQTVLISIIAPYVIQVLSIILLGLIVLIRDSTSVDAIINILLVIAGGNAVAGGTIGAVHLYTRSKGGL